MTETLTEPNPLAAVGLPQRLEARFPVNQPSLLKVTWLVHGRAVNGIGLLLDLSRDGFRARLTAPPPRGCILHARALVGTLPGVPQKLIEAGVRVCGMEPVDAGADGGQAWIVHFAIQAIHPADRKTLTRVVNLLKLAQAEPDPQPDPRAGSGPARTPDGERRHGNYLRLKRPRPHAAGC